MVSKEAANKYLKPKFARVSGMTLRSIWDAPRWGECPIEGFWKTSKFSREYHGYKGQFAIQLYPHFLPKGSPSLLHLDQLPPELAELFVFKEIRGKKVSELRSVSFNSDTTDYTSWADIDYFAGNGRDSCIDMSYMYGNDPTEYDCPFFDKVFALLGTTISSTPTI